MTSDIINGTGLQPHADTDERLFDTWFDPIESVVRDRVRGFIEDLIEGELATVLARPRYGRRAKDGDSVATSAGVAGHRHGSRTRTLTGTFARTEIAVPERRWSGWFVRLPGNLLREMLGKHCEAQNGCGADPGDYRPQDTAWERPSKRERELRCDMLTTCRREGDTWILNGQKKWIGNSTFSDINVIWARDEASGQVKGFVVDKDNPGYSVEKIKTKMALRVVQNGLITLKDCACPRQTACRTPIRLRTVGRSCG